MLTLFVSAPAYAESTFGCGAADSKTNINYTLHQPAIETVNNSCAATMANPSGPVVTLGGEVFIEYHCEAKANGEEIHRCEVIVRRHVGEPEVGMTSAARSPKCR